MLSPKKIFENYRVQPLKRLGQNFLTDARILEKIIAASDLSLEDTILEIGPGLGILTTELAKRAKKIIAVEKDKNLCRILKNILEEKNIQNVEIINQDILKISNFKFLISKQILNPNYKIIANLPYYIASPVIRKFLETENKPEIMVLMVQKEVAQRIIAKPPKMSLLAVAIQFYAQSKIISYVSKNSFWPQPKVDSAIIKIIPRQTPKISTKKLFELVKKGFSSKRKMLKNNLKIKESILEKLGFNPKIRAENLSVENWVKLYDKIYQPH